MTLIKSSHDHEVITDSDCTIHVLHYHATVTGSNNTIHVNALACRLTGNNNTVFIYVDSDVLFTSPNNTLDGVNPIPQANLIALEQAEAYW